MNRTRLLELAGLTEAKEKAQQIGFEVNIEEETVGNEYYRRVLYTTKNNQLVVMSLKPGEEIGSEIHSDTAQFIRFEAGEGKCIIGGKNYLVASGDAVVIPAGVRHNVVNTSKEDNLKLYTVYSPPVHPEGTVQVEKPEESE